MSGAVLGIIGTASPPPPEGMRSGRQQWESQLVTSLAGQGASAWKAVPLTQIRLTIGLMCRARAADLRPMFSAMSSAPVHHDGRGLCRRPACVGKSMENGAPNARRPPLETVVLGLAQCINRRSIDPASAAVHDMLNAADRESRSHGGTPFMGPPLGFALEIGTRYPRKMLRPNLDDPSDLHH